MVIFLRRSWQAQRPAPAFKISSPLILAFLSGLFGVAFEENGVRFAPVVPERFEQLSLSNVKDRNATLRVVVKGHGTDIKQFSLDGKKARQPFFKADLTGSHEIEIQVK